jgi:hypothetical protein
VFAHAANVLIGDDLWTLLPGSQLDAPFGIRLAEWPDRFERLAPPGARVHVRAGHMGIGRSVIDCRTATRWSPQPIRRSADPLDAPLQFVERRARPRAWCESQAMADDLLHALRRSQSGRHLEAARIVSRNVGRGPGLTPAGDDVLVGAITVLVSGASGPVDDGVLPSLTSMLSEAWHTTSEISRHLLSQAVRGLPGQGLHDLSKSLLEGARVEVLDDALDRVLATGATSGADACLGMISACRYAFLEERFAA